MKKFAALLFFVVFGFNVSAQKVDSIRVEQSGDFIKIKYKILDSRPDQVFRVRILGSMNNGLNTELRSVTGDTGEQVMGGKSEYWVVWDVLKDVDELKSYEFIIRAEVIKDLSKISTVQIQERMISWDKKRFNVLATIMGPGPKAGIRIGYLGSFGGSFQFTHGKLEKGDVAMNFGDTPAFGFNLTKRLVNVNNFQLHLAAGLHSTTLIFFTNDPMQPYSYKMVKGPEFGLISGLSRVSFCLSLIHFNPGPIENGTELEILSPINYLSFGLGVRF